MLVVLLRVQNLRFWCCVRVLNSLFTALYFFRWSLRTEDRVRSGHERKRAEPKGEGRWEREK